MCNVVSLYPHVVEVDVLLELHLKTMETTLCFGPFNTKEAAEEWCLGLENEHRVIEGREAIENDNALKQVGIPTKPFFSVSVRGTNLPPPEIMAKAKGALISPSTPVVDAHQIHIYALESFADGITYIRRFLAGAEEKK